MIFIALGFLSSCKSDDLKPEELALHTAKVYYEQLISGDVDSFVDGFYVRDSIVPSYREQLVANMKMYVAQQEKDHKGISGIQTVSAAMDKDSHIVSAFLMLSFADNTKEKVVVPMIEKDGVWLMK